jgi:RNA polymerase sigma-70 factor, ECF subfamily
VTIRTQTFETEALRHLDSLYRYALRLARNPERAEDLVQETYVRAASSVGRLAEVKAIRPTLFRILHNLFIDQWRADQRGPIMISTDTAGDNHAPLPLLCTDDNPREALFRNALSDEVEQALSELDATWRETLWLRDVEGYSYAEISQMTSAPIGSVRSRLARARRAMADKLVRLAGARNRHHIRNIQKGQVPS